MSMLGSKHMERQQTLRFPAAVELTKELLWKQELTDLAPPPSKPFLCTQRNDHTLTSNLLFTTETWRTKIVGGKLSSSSDPCVFPTLTATSLQEPLCLSNLPAPQTSVSDSWAGPVTSRFCEQAPPPTLNQNTGSSQGPITPRGWKITRLIPSRKAAQICIVCPVITVPLAGKTVPLAGH